MPTSRRDMVGLVVLLVAVLTTHGALAQNVGGFPFDRFSFTVGSFYETTDTDFRLDASTNHVGTPITLEKDLGLDDSGQLLRLSAEWLPFERHQFGVAYYDLSRDRRRTLDREFEFNGTVFPVNASLESESDFKFADLLYTYWAVKTPRGGLGLGLGASWVSIDMHLRAQVATPGGGGMASRDASGSTDLPVPLLGIEGRYTLTPRLLIAGDVRALPNVTIGEYEANALLYGVRLEYRFSRHFGLGAAWNSFNVDADVNREKFHGSLDFTIEGAQAFLRVAL